MTGLKTYVQDIIQRMTINVCINNERLIEYGITQGSVLGLILFCLCVKRLWIDAFKQELTVCEWHSL